jgi:predicted nucleic acid-binding protein
MRHLVLDASVGIKTRVAEPLSDRATALLQSLDRGTTISVPDLFFVECANVLWKYVRRLGYSAPKARADLVQLLDLPLAVARTADLALAALDLAREHDITVYDASYLEDVLKHRKQHGDACKKHELAWEDWQKTCVMDCTPHRPAPGPELRAPSPPENILPPARRERPATLPTPRK